MCRADKCRYWRREKTKGENSHCREVSSNIRRAFGLRRGTGSSSESSSDATYPYIWLATIGRYSNNARQCLLQPQLTILRRWTGRDWAQVSTGEDRGTGTDRAGRHRRPDTYASPQPVERGVLSDVVIFQHGVGLPLRGATRLARRLASVADNVGVGVSIDVALSSIEISIIRCIIIARLRRVIFRDVSVDGNIFFYTIIIGIW